MQLLYIKKQFDKLIRFSQAFYCDCNDGEAGVRCHVLGCDVLEVLFSMQGGSSCVIMLYCYYCHMIYMDGLVAR